MNRQQLARSPWRRRIPSYLLLVAMVVLVVGYMRRRPVEVEVVYRFGKLARGLRMARMRYLAGGEEMARVRFSYRVVAAPRRQRHTVALPRGDYDVEIALDYGEPGSARRIQRGSVAKRRSKLRRPLIVRGEGEVTIVIDDSP